MGGPFFVPNPYTEDPVPYVWRARFPPEIQARLVSEHNPQGSITNSDLELAGAIGQEDVIAHTTDVREQYVYTLDDNTPTISWQGKGSTTTTGPAAYLLRVQALHQRYYRYCPCFSHITGEANVIVDDCSRLWHLSDDEFLAYLNLTYPQKQPWRLCQPRPKRLSTLISALLKKRPEPESFLAPPELPT